MSNNEELDKILEDLKNEDLTNTTQPQSADRLDINDENVNDFVQQKVGTLVESGIETIQAIQQTIASGFEAEELAAFAGLITSVTNAADVLNKINIQNKKAKSAKEIKQMDIAAKKQIGESSGHGGRGDTNILIATREEVIEKFLNNNKEYIEAKATEAEETLDDDENE